MYSAGKDGDLRDIWRRVIGEIPLEKGASSSGTAKIMTVHGKDGVDEHKVNYVTMEIAVIGKHLQDRDAKRVAIYLPNNLEFLSTLFAAAFYGFTPILIPYNQPHQTLIDLLNETKADALIAQAGSVPLAEVTQGAAGLRSIIWTVDVLNRHMDWSEVPEGIGGKIDVAVWHELVAENKNPATTLPSTAGKPPNVVFLWQEAVGKPAEIVEFTQQVSLLNPSYLLLANSRRTWFPPSVR
jgi:acyl-CoA synthetase (AMP-forming)/AMP-acid ligase II